MFSGRKGDFIYKYGKIVHKIKNGWYGNNFYKNDILMYSKVLNINGQAPPDYWGQKPGSNSTVGSTTGPMFSNGTSVPVIQSEKPRDVQ